ncbi:uncharacterized protein LOC125902715 [Epinephelus fuscoguttatus]|uniref:uncharacterized protein LOC125902715 n=1 Tax=Epinephelus fuscoguttatus TaxID=293821 RepID=UPI0020D1C078|nr:uncharacterized protein LOC125902715 [Epinephelus fuscoguttatus]
MASAGVSAGALRHRETSSVDINAKTANLSKMREICLGQKINHVHMPTLRKGEVLGFVSKIVFNTNDVHLCGRTEVDGSCEARWKIMNFSLKGKKKDNSSFTVPAGHIYGYRFNEIKFKEEEDIQILNTCRYEAMEWVSGRMAEITREPNIFKSGDSIKVTLNYLQKMQEGKRKPSLPSPIRLDEVALEPGTSESDDSTEETLETLQQMQEVDEVALEPGTSESDDSTEETLDTLLQMQEEFTYKSHIEYVGGKAEEQRLSPPSPIRLDEVALEPGTSESDDSTEETLDTLLQMQEEFTYKSHIEYVGGKAEEQRLSPPSPIRLVEKALEPETFEPDDSTEETLETLQQVREKLLRTETVLRPLAHLPRVTRFALFQSLSVLSEDRDALTLLKKKLDQWRAGEPLEQPQSQSVCSVLHLLSGFATPPSHTGSRMTDSTLEAVYLLVSAMDKLPEHVTSLIAKYRPDTLRGLNQLVSSLMEDGQAHLSESLPAALQDGGQLHWLAVFLCSSDESLREPSEQTIVAGDEPGVLLLALCVAVRGLSMLRQ